MDKRKATRFFDANGGNVPIPTFLFRDNLYVTGYSLTSNVKAQNCESGSKRNATREGKIDKLIIVNKELNSALKLQTEADPSKEKLLEKLRSNNEKTAFFPVFELMNSETEANQYYVVEKGFTFEEKPSF